MTEGNSCKELLHSAKMCMKWISVLLLIQSCYLNTGNCGKILVWSTDHSHWIVMKTFLDELIKRNHEVTVLTSTASIFIGATKSTDIKFEIYSTSLTKDDLKGFYKQLTRSWAYDVPKSTFFWTRFSKIQELTCGYFDVYKKLCKDLVSNRKLMIKLQPSLFDVILADAAGLCGELLAEILKVPFVYSIRYSPGSVFEKNIGGIPLPPSYVPVLMSELKDKMTFIERVKNMLYMLYFDYWFQVLHEKKWVQFYSEVLGRPTKLYELMGKAEIWLIRNYWDFQFPHPCLPNFEFIGGMHCKPANPLPKEMEEFVQSSGENGIVVFTLGSMVSGLSEERANVIASALAQIPQKVLWRFVGKKPDTLGENTKLYKWLPQNDLLGHPKTKAFITHGGANGIYEAIYHGIPIVGIPLFAEQPDNIVHMVAKGAAVKVDLITMSSSDLLNALKKVIDDPLYKENALKLKAIHHDQPMKPLDRAVFWTEFVMRHKGAKHLRPASHALNLLQYHSLDVIGFLLACVATALWVITKCCLCCCRMFSKTGKKKKKE